MQIKKEVGITEINIEYNRLIQKAIISIQNTLLILFGIPIMGFGAFQFLMNYQNLVIGSIEPLSRAGFLGFIFWIIWMIFVILALPFIIYFVTKKITEFFTNIAIIPFRKFIEKIEELLIELSNSVENKIFETQNFSEILSKLSEIQKLLQILKIIKIVSFFHRKVHYQIQVALYSTIKWTIKVLLNLRSDLQLRLTEQQQTLEQAKAEVSNHVHCTNELNQVSELQRARLDKQIEQFEELQRVLVKV